MMRLFLGALIFKMKGVIRMKKRIAIISLIVFIVLVLGIAISVGAASELFVRSDTAIDEMIDVLNKGGKLVIGKGTKASNDYIICSNRFWPVWNDSKYTKVDRINLPGSYDNGHAMAYILAAPGYVTEEGSGDNITKSDERQYAWHFINGESKSGETSNALYKIAMAYQGYKKKDEVQTVVTKPENDEITEIDNYMVYGPIEITYSYGNTTSGQKSDEWGGFYYSFYDENDTKVNDKVKLCTLNDGKYTPIDVTEVAEGDNLSGYYQVKEATYSNKSLYAITSDLYIGNVYLRIRDNKVDYSARIYNLEGEAWREGGTPLCTECSNKISNATSSIQSAINNSGMLNYLGNYYEFSSKSTVNMSVSKNSTPPKNKARIGGSDIDLDSTGTSNGYTGCAGCKKSSCSGGQNISSSDFTDEYRT